MTDGYVSWNNLKILATKNRSLPNRLRESAELHSETAAIMKEAADMIETLRKQLRDLTEEAYRNDI